LKSKLEEEKAALNTQLTQVSSEFDTAKKGHNMHLTISNKCI
jgi:hypothetical protein